MSHPLFERHRALIDLALKAIAERGYWSPFPESPSPKVYGEGAADAGKAAFDALANRPFPMTLPGTVGTVGGERSPYGITLGISYPRVDLDQLFNAIAAAEKSWRKAGPEAWVGVALEILARINKRSFEIAHAVMHTTG
ncbi:MAG: phenylacetic acid degradation protein PaaN, partial [Betaproteobacteria bacterium]